MVTKANDPVLDLQTEPVVGINMNGVGNGINMDGSPLKNLAAPVDPGDAVRLSDLITSAIPVGSGPLPWAGGEVTVPSGWLLCDGTVYNIIDYPALHTILQNTYGGDNITTFGVPDLRGRIPLGRDDMGGSAAGVVPSATVEGMTGGSEEHILSVLEIPVHTHIASTGVAGSHTHTGSTDPAGVHVHSTSGGGVPSTTGASGSNKAIKDQPGNTGSAGSHSHTLTINPVSDHTHTVTVSPEGNGDPHNNMQPYIVVNYIIKAL